MKNPWLGLSSYTEESLNEYHFYGRSAAIAGLSSLIRGNLFVTLYGRSGIGKTSLLQAGVFPVLRKNGMLPVAIRLSGVSDDKNPAAETVWEILLTTLEASGYKYTTCDSSDQYAPDFGEVLVFRKLFSAGRFLNAAGEETSPVIVLDQFEEVLYNAPKAGKLLISQLYALIDDNYNLNVLHPHWHDDTNFRVVISIREDDLYLFEDAIDSLNCVEFKSNRYRLLPLTDIEAKEVVLLPALSRHIFEEGEEDSIADAIIELSKSNGQKVNTLLLSLICYVLYNNFVTHGKSIAISDLDNYNNVIETYYKEVTKNLPKDQRYYIEDNLVDNQGRRTSIYLSDLEKYAPQAKELMGNSNHRLLNENQGRVEFIHDQLAASISKIRNARKSERSKRFGVLALIAILSCVFLFSFSRPANTVLYQDALNLISDVNTTSITIDSINGYYDIFDCPSLKEVNILSQDGNVYIYNCPSLIRISYPENFDGMISVFNCPNINLNDAKIVRSSFLDSIQYVKYRSQHPYVGKRVSKSDYDRFYNYDSINNTITILRTPIVVNAGQDKRFLIPTGLTDSVKTITDCYVPFGEKNKYSRLTEYQPFRSIRERGIYHIWQTNASGMFAFLSQRVWLILTLMAIFVVQCFFWVIAFNKYQTQKRNTLVAFSLSFVYGIGMSLLAILSFMSFYWTVYNIMLPGNQSIASVIGCLGCLICLFFVYKNVFYSFQKELKNRGIHGLIRDIKDCIFALPTQIRLFCRKSGDMMRRLPDFLNNNTRMTIAILATIVFVTAASLFYFNGREKREFYLISLNEILDKGEYTRAYAIIQELKNQHKSTLYPSFTEELGKIEKKIDGDSINLTHRITSTYINELASQQNTHLGFTNISKLLAISNDGSKLVICVEYPKSNDLQKDLYQAILLDLKNQSVDILTEKSKSWSYSFKSCFSPSGNSLIVTDGEKVYSYSNIDKSILDITNYRNDDLNDVILVNDSIYYFTDYGRLFKDIIKPDSQPKIINESEDIYDNLIVISEDLIGSTGNWSEIIIYNTAIDSVCFHSKQRNIGELRSINNDYAITTKGLFNIERDTLINENDQLYEYKGNIVELQKHDNQYSFFDLAGNNLVKINTDGEDYLNNIVFSKDGNIIINDRNGIISIYSIIPIAERTWKISKEDRQMFDLD